MFDLEDGLTFESYRIPWLFWIQILIFFLLIFLICCFSVFTSDPFDINTTNFLSSSASPSPINGVFVSQTLLNKGVFHHNVNTTSILHRRRNQVAESRADINGDEVATSTSGIREEETENEAGLSTNVLNDIHPCNYFRLAKLAFLKCFGLDATSDHSEPTNER